MLQQKASISSAICYTKYMTTRQNGKIIAPVGLAGSGKSSAVEYLSEKGYPKVYVGGLIVQGVIDQGLEVTPENERAYREEMRAKHGKEVFMNMAIDQMHRLIDAGQHTIILDGLYTWTEYKMLKHAFPGELTTIAIVTPKHLRYNRMSRREHRPLQPHEVDERDWAEIENLEKGGPIAIADYFVHNDGSIEKLHQQVDAVIETAGFTK